MMRQAKQLKDLLRSMGATKWGGRKVTVKTEITRIGPRMYEYGRAVAFVDPLTDKQKDIIMQNNKYAKIYTDTLGCLVKY
jgi:hypothetical protein